MGFGSNPLPRTTQEQFTVDITGEKDILRAFRELGARVERKIMRTALTKAARPIAREAKAILKGHNFHDSHGVLWRSIGVKTKTRRNGITYAVIGPQRRKGRWVVPLADKRKKGGVRFKALNAKQVGRAMVTGQITGGAKALRVFRNPTNYAHLIEFGTGGFGGRFSRRLPFMRRAWNRMGGDTALGVIRTELKKGVEREARKLAAKGGK